MGKCISKKAKQEFPEGERPIQQMLQGENPHKNKSFEKKDSIKHTYQVTRNLTHERSQAKKDIDFDGLGVNSNLNGERANIAFQDPKKKLGPNGQTELLTPLSMITLNTQEQNKEGLNLLLEKFQE